MADQSSDKHRAKAGSAPAGSHAGGSSASQRLLGNLRAQLDHLEADFSQREEQLAQAEDDLRGAEVRLKAQLGKLALERERLEKDYSRQLVEKTKQLEANAAALQEQRRHNVELVRQQRELSGRVESLARDRDRLAAALGEARQRSEEQQRELAALREQLTHGRGEGAGDTTTIAGAAAPAAGVEASIEEPGGREEARGEAGIAAWRFSWRHPVTVAGMSILALSGLVAIVSYSRHAPTYRVVGVVTARPGDVETLAVCAEGAAGHGVSVARMNSDRGLLELAKKSSVELLERDRQAVDQAGQVAVARFVPLASQVRVTKPASEDDRERLVQHIADLDRRLAATASQPTGGPTDGEEGERFLAVWAAAERERAEVEASLAASSRQRPATLPAENELQVDPARLRAGERDDQKLQSEIEVLNQRQKELVEALGKLLASGESAFDSFAQSAAHGAAHLSEAGAGGHSETSRRALAEIQKAITDWSEASSALAQAWREQRESLADSGADPLPCQAELDRAGRAFVDAASSGLVQFRSAMNAINQDSDQPTKSLVLHSTLTRELQPVLDARQAVESAARSAMLADNLDLVALVQRVSGLRRQVEERRSAIESSVRRQVRADLQGKQEQVHVAEGERFRRRASELGALIGGYVAEGRALIAAGGRQRTRLARLIELEHERAETLKELAGLESARARQLAELKPPPEVHYVPARVESTGSSGHRLGRAFLAGGGTLLAGLAVSVGFHLLRSWQRTRKTIDTYTRELRAAARREMTNGE